jgi:DNA-binding beta-propeller fold protein YncE
MRLPTLADSWSFTWVPERDEDSITLDGVIDGTNVNSYGCSAITEDADRGFLYVGCKLVPYVYVIDIRDDSTDDFDDLNYLDVESAILVESSTNSQSGMRSMVIDRDRGWLWGVADTPEAIYAIDLGNVVDDADAEFTREQVLAMLPLPRKDAGVVTESPVGPADLAMHPDGHHMFVSNFNDNSVSVYDLSIGPIATLVGEVGAIGENPYAIVLSADGTFGAVGNFAGEVTDASTHSTIALFDADPESPTFLQVKTWLVNK